jgi:hypothetical protein
MEIRIDIARFGVERRLGVRTLLELLALLQKRLRLFLVVPEVWIADFFLE